MFKTVIYIIFSIIMEGGNSFGYFYTEYRFTLQTVACLFNSKIIIIRTRLPRIN